jgi:predicted nucleotidyltransferase component of viral defense system
MILPSPADAIHKAWLYRLLTAIADNTFLISVLRFKGGTCAAMLNLLDRFSLDLDFDLLEPPKMTEVRKNLETIFSNLDLEIKEQSRHVPQYFLKYKNRTGERNTLRLDVTFPPPKSNEYEAVRFPDIDRILYCQTIPTMFANKLVTVMDRYKKHGSIAGRDLYDLHTFFIKGYSYNPQIIEERTGQKAKDFLVDLKNFIEKNITQTIIDQDLNMLLPPAGFHKMRKLIKPEVLMFLNQN